MSMLSPVSFHGDTIFCINHNDQPYTAMRPIVENMGLDWRSQQAKITSCNRWSVVNITTVAQDGVMRQSLCMPVRKLPAFLASINPKKVKPELRERIELYQAECDEVLWQYWTEGQATRTPTPETPAPATPDPDDRLSKRSDPERKALTAVVNMWIALGPMHPAAARMQVNAHFGRASIDELTVNQVREAIQWVQAKIDALPPAGTRGSMPPPPPLLPQPVRTIATMTAEAKKHEGKNIAQRNADYTATRRRELYQRLETLINDTHFLLRDAHFTPFDNLIDHRLFHLHRDLYLMAESSMRSALDAMKAGLDMAG